MNLSAYSAHVFGCLQFLYAGCISPALRYCTFACMNVIALGGITPADNSFYGTGVGP